MIVERSFVAALFGNELYFVSLIMMLTISVMTIVVSLLGYVAAWKLSKKMLLFVRNCFNNSYHVVFIPY